MLYFSVLYVACQFLTVEDEDSVFFPPPSSPHLCPPSVYLLTFSLWLCCNFIRNKSQHSHIMRDIHRFVIIMFVLFIPLWPFSFLEYSFVHTPLTIHPSLCLFVWCNKQQCSLSLSVHPSLENMLFNIKLLPIIWGYSSNYIALEEISSRAFWLTAVGTSPLCQCTAVILGSLFTSSSGVLPSLSHVESPFPCILCFPLSWFIPFY